MTTYQLSKSLSVQRIAAIIRMLTRKQKDQLCDLVWDDLHEISDEQKRILDERIKFHEENPGRMISWEEVEKKWASYK